MRAACAAPGPRDASQATEMTPPRTTSKNVTRVRTVRGGYQRIPRRCGLGYGTEGPRMEAVDQVQLNFDPATLTVLNILIGLIMFGVALDIRVDDFRRVLRDPRGPLIGLAAQFLLLPAMTFVLVWVIDPLPSIALGMMMVAACPGGNF